MYLLVINFHISQGLIGSLLGSLVAVVLFLIQRLCDKRDQLKGNKPIIILGDYKIYNRLQLENPRFYDIKKANEQIELELVNAGNTPISNISIKMEYPNLIKIIREMKQTEVQTCSTIVDKEPANGCWTGIDVTLEEENISFVFQKNDVVPQNEWNGFQDGYYKTPNKNITDYNFDDHLVALMSGANVNVHLNEDFHNIISWLIAVEFSNQKTIEDLELKFTITYRDYVGHEQKIGFDKKIKIITRTNESQNDDHSIIESLYDLKISDLSNKTNKNKR